MSSSCYASIQLCAIRLAKLTDTGAPLIGTHSGYCSNAAIKLDVDVTLNKGDDFEQKNGCGALISVFQTPDRVKSLALALDLCQLDFELISFLDGSDTFSSGGNVVGMQWPSISDTAIHQVCFEGWSKAWSGSQVAVAPVTSPNATWYHWVFPLTQWAQGKKTLENNLMVVPMTGIGDENAHITSNGPFDDWPTYIANAGGITRIGGVFLDGTVPPTQCGSFAVTGADS